MRKLVIECNVGYMFTELDSEQRKILIFNLMDGLGIKYTKDEDFISINKIELEIKNIPL